MTILDLLSFKRWGFVSDANRPILVRCVISSNLRTPFRGHGNRSRRRQAVRFTPPPMSDLAADIRLEGYFRRPFRTSPHE